MGGIYEFWRISELLYEHAHLSCPHWRDDAIANLLFIFDAVPTIFLMVLLIAAIITMDVYVVWINVALYVAWAVVYIGNWAAGVVGPQGSECIYPADQMLDDSVVQMVIVTVMYLMIGVNNRTWIIPWYYTVSLMYGLWCIYLNHLYRRVNTVHSMLLSTWVGVIIGLVFYAMMPLVFPSMRRCIDHSPILRWMEMRNRYFRNLGDPFHLGQSLIYRERGLAPIVADHYYSSSSSASDITTSEKSVKENILSRYLAVPDDRFLQQENDSLTCIRLSMAVWMKQLEQKSDRLGFYSLKTQARDVLQSLALTEEEDLYATIGASITNKLENNDNETIGADTKKLVIEERSEQNVIELYKFIQQIVRPDSDVI